MPFWFLLQRVGFMNSLICCEPSRVGIMLLGLGRASAAAGFSGHNCWRRHALAATVSVVYSLCVTQDSQLLAR